jgi:transcriptional regulator with XRE-family HTH domain
MSAISDALRVEFRDPEDSEGYAESFLNSYVATQIKVIREQRRMKQSDLAREVGTTQTAISRIENVNYSSWNIKTLKKLARAFRVRLMVSFETYGTLADEVGRFTRESLQRTEREKDPGLLERKAPHGAEVNEIGVQAMAAAMRTGTLNSNLPRGGNLLVIPNPTSQTSTISQPGGLNAAQSGLNR